MSKILKSIEKYINDENQHNNLSYYLAAGQYISYIGDNEFMITGKSAVRLVKKAVDKGESFQNFKIAKSEMTYTSTLYITVDYK